LQASVCVQFHPSLMCAGFRATVHVGNVRQTAVVEGVCAAVPGLGSNQSASVLFRFLSRPEYVKVGQRLLFREGKANGIGKITQVRTNCH
jgi:GTPase